MVLHEDFMRSFRTIRFTSMLCVAFFASVLIHGAIYGQTRTASVSGVVSDSSGALIPGAAISMRGPDGAEQMMTSDGLGQFSFQRLAPGRYQMGVSATGFSVRSGIIVDVLAGRSTTYNVQLEIAVVEQQVEILAGSVVGRSVDRTFGRGDICRWLFRREAATQIRNPGNPRESESFLRGV